MKLVPFEITDQTGAPLPDWWLELPIFERANRLADFLKTGRNEPCPCDSGKKYKKCCLPLSGTYKPEVKTGPTKTTSGGGVSIRLAMALAALSQNK